jgi:heme exporter protein D
MTFYVEKKLALGPISFGVTPGQTTSDDDSALSTGATGEFIRRDTERFFFGGNDPFSGPTLPQARSITSTPFLSSLKPDGTPRSYGLLASLAFGILFVLLGIAVVGRKGPQGWVEVILGLIMVAVPIVMTAQKRKKILEQEERDRAEREAVEKRNRETLAAYTAALDRALQTRDDASLAQLRREREALTLPNTIWSGVARRTLLLIAFDELKKRGPEGSGDVAHLIDRAGQAAGLSAEDAEEIKREVYGTIVWHLLAAGRIGKSQTQQLDRIRMGFGIDDQEAKAIEQFQRVREVTPRTLPKIRCSTQLQFQEYCIYETATDQGTLHITNKRNLLEGKKTIEVPRAFDVTVNANESSITLKTDNPKKPLRLKVEEPIYAAAVLDAASQIDERPRGFA